MSPMITRSTQSTASRLTNDRRRSAAGDPLRRGSPAGWRGGNGRVPTLLMRPGSVRSAVRSAVPRRDELRRRGLPGRGSLHVALVLLCAVVGGLSTAVCGLSRHQPPSPAAPRPRPADRHAAGRRSGGTGRDRRPRFRLVRHRGTLLGSRLGRPEPHPGSAHGGPRDEGRGGDVVGPGGTSEPGSSLSGVSCPTVTSCMAVGSDASGSDLVLTTHDGGAAWSQAAAPANATRITSVTCKGIAMCIAIVTNGTTPVVIAQHRLRHDVATSGQPARHLPDGDRSRVWRLRRACLVAGYVPTGAGHGAGALALSADEGQTWEDTTVPAGLGLLQTVACATPTSCFAAGTTSTTVSDVVPAKGQLLQSVDGGHTWASAPVPPVDDAYGLACPSARQCAMVGTDWAGAPAVGTGAVAQSADGGQTFTPSSSAYVPLTLAALSCPTAVACIAVGGDTLARITLQSPAPTHARTTTTAGAPNEEP